MSVSKSDNSDACINAINGAVRAALGDVGQKAVDYARQTVPVRTGALRDSIGSEVSGNTVTIGAGESYAAYVCLGTAKQPPRPYLKPSVYDHTDEYMEIIKNKISNIL